MGIIKPLNKDYVTPEKFGAIGDGVHDDTNAFIDALLNESTVYVPSGTYLLNNTITIKDGCKLILDRDTHLKFTQTDTECIVVGKYAVLEGGYATISVTENFTNNVVVIDSEIFNTEQNAVFPFSSWYPQCKSSAIVKNLTICKVKNNGTHTTSDGTCSGNAIYIHTVKGHFLWNTIINEINVSGAFSNGIYSFNNNGWNHDMKIDKTSIAHCEIGVHLVNTNNSYIDVTVQPSLADDKTKYAKYGLLLENSKMCYAPTLRIWDWHNSLIETDSKYQHIGLIGDCSSFIFGDFTYHQCFNREIFWSSIYTDTPENYNTVTCINETNRELFNINKFDVPYVNLRSGKKQLITNEDAQTLMGIESIKPNYTNILTMATETTEENSPVLNDVGYIYATHNGSKLEATKYAYLTGFIKVTKGDVLRFKNFVLNTVKSASNPVINTYANNIAYFDLDGNYIKTLGITAELVNGNYDSQFSYNEKGQITGTTIQTIWRNSVPYQAGWVRITFGVDTTTGDPIITKNEEITETFEGNLNSGIKVDYSQIINSPIEELIKRVENLENKIESSVTS